MKTQLRNSLTAVLLLLIPTLNFAQAPPLGTAADFVLFTSVGAVTNIGTYKYLTYLTGNVGTNSGSSTNFGNVNGVMHDNDGASAQCAADLLIAYNSLSAAIPDSTLGPVIGNGDTLKAGIYLMPGATSLNLGLTLNAEGDSNAVFIFKTPFAVAYAFTANPNSKIHLINGAKACNVFWQVSGAVDLGAGTTMRGNIIAHGAISMAAQDTLEGRALTINGAVTVSNGALGFLAYTPIGCGSPILNGPAAPTFVGLASYAVFATTGLASDCGTSHVTGDVGGNTVQPTGWNPDSVTGTIHFNDPSTQAAAADLLLIYNNLLGLAYDIQLLDPAEFGHNLVLTPHTYQMNSAVTFTDTLYLDAMGNADAVFIIKTFGAFASTPGSKVLLVNGTQAKNVYWLVTGAVSITANSNFKGAIIAHDAIDILIGAKLNGRAFSTNGAISTCGMTATIPSTSIIITTQPSNQTACAGSSVSFSVTASGTGLTYQWRKGVVPLTNGGNISGATSSTLTINPVNISDAATDYNVVISGPSVPNDTSINVSLIVNPLLPVSVSIAASANPVCAGTAVTFTATPTNGGTTPSYQWKVNGVNAGTNNSVYTYTPVNGNVVTCVLTSNATCPTGNPATSNAITMTVNPLLPVSVSIAASVNPVCAGTAVTFTATPTNGGTTPSYQWKVNGVNAGTNNPVYTYTPVNGNVITCVLTSNATPCATGSPATSNTITMIVNTNPVATASNNGPLCAGSTLNLTGGPASMTTYAWTGPNGFISNVQNPSIPNVTTAATGVYTLIVTNASGCSGSASTTIVINAYPIATAANNGPMCAGLTLGLFGQPSGMTSYAWTGPNGFTSNVQNPIINNVTVAASGWYTLIVSNSGCTSLATTYVIIFANPAATAANNGPLCVGSTLNLTGGPAGMTTYAWTGPNGFTSNVQSPSIPNVTIVAAGLYTLIVTNASGCSATANTTVVVNPIPVAPVITEGNFNILTSSAPIGNQWYYNGLAIPGATGQTYTATLSGVYWCIVTINGCSSPESNHLDVIIIGLQELPSSASFVVYPVPNDGLFNASIRYPVEDTFTITVYNQLGSKVFELHDVTAVGGKYDTQIDLRPAASGIYSVVFVNSGHKVIRKVIVNK